jgi:hypothetical protein
MNPKRLPSLILTATALFLLPAFAAFTPPTDDQIDQALANPDSVTALLGDASAEQAADLLSRILARVESANVSPSQKNYLAAFFSARISFLLGPAAGPMLDALGDAIPDSVKPAVFAGLAMGMRGSSDAMATLRLSTDTDPILDQAVNDPSSTLTPGVYNQVNSSFNPRRSPTTISPAPLLDPVTGTPIASTDDTILPPPVPQPYLGQQ